MYDTDTPLYRKLRWACLGLALFFLLLGILISVILGKSYPLRGAGAASFLFAILSDRLQPGYKEFWKAMGLGLFFFVGYMLLKSYVEALILFGLWCVFLLSRWRGLRQLWIEETRGYRILMVGGLIVVSALLFTMLWTAAETGTVRDFDPVIPSSEGNFIEITPVYY